METTIRKLHQAISDTISEKRRNGQDITLDVLQELLPMIEIANGLCLLRQFAEVIQDEPIPTIETATRLVNDFTSEIKQKLGECETHYKKWLESKNETYKNMSKDALRHSEAFIALARKNAQSNEDRQEIQRLIERHNIDLARLV